MKNNVNINELALTTNFTCYQVAVIIGTLLT